MYKNLGLALLLGSLLIACGGNTPNPTKEPLDFHKHGSVLRGKYTGVFENGTLKSKKMNIDVVAQDLKDGQYKVKGEGQLNKGKIDVEGNVDAKDMNYQATVSQATLPTPPKASLSIKPELGITTNLTCVLDLKEPYSWTCTDINNTTNKIILKKETQ